MGEGDDERGKMMENKIQALLVSSIQLSACMTYDNLSFERSSSTGAYR